MGSGGEGPQAYSGIAGPASAAKLPTMFLKSTSAADWWESFVHSSIW